MVGLDKIKEYFAEHGDHYALIGGAACDLLFTRAGLNFRATKDLDMVICVEVIHLAFAKRFAKFLDAGKYEARAVSEGEKHFYRFAKPADKAFPHTIELFARPQVALGLPPTDAYVRLAVEDDILSLSALLLEENYYAALKDGRETVEGVSILNVTLLIPFKARAFLDISQRRANGGSVDSDDIKKHRNDVFRLIQLLPGDGAIALPDPIKSDLRRFITATEDDKSLNPKSLAVPKDDGIAILKRFYAL